MAYASRLRDRAHFLPKNSAILSRAWSIANIVAVLDLDLLDWRAIRLDHLRGLVHRVRGKDEIIVAGNEENGRVDLLKPLDEIAAARDKDLGGLDEVEKVIGVRLRRASLARSVKCRLDRVLAFHKATRRVLALMDLCSEFVVKFSADISTCRTCRMAASIGDFSPIRSKVSDSRDDHADGFRLPGDAVGVLDEVFRTVGGCGMLPLLGDPLRRLLGGHPVMAQART